MPPLAKESGLSQERGACGWKKQEEAKDLPPLAKESGPSQKREACGWKKQEEAKDLPPVAKESGAFAEARGLRLEEAKGGNEICRLCGRNLIKLAEYKEDGHPCKCLEKCGRPCRKFYDKIHTTVAWIML